MEQKNHRRDKFLREAVVFLRKDEFMFSNIANSLGVGAGIDTNQIVNDLAAASREPKIQRLDALTEANQARISAVALVRSSLENFTTSLEQVAQQGGFNGAPTVSDESFLTASVTGNAALGNVASEIQISQLARSQTVYSAPISDPEAPIGQGIITLSVGGEDFDITIDASNDSLSGLAEAVNASGSGVRANIVNDDLGARLVLKGETGLDGAFTLSTSTPSLDAFTYSGGGGGMTLGQAAQNAEFTVDGISYTRSENEAVNILPGLSLSLLKVTDGESVTIGRNASTENIRQNIDDFINAFNTLRNEVADARSTTRGDFSMRRLEQQLGALISSDVNGAAQINSLSDIGISTNRDGTISLNSERLDEILASDPDAVIALFAPPSGAAIEGESPNGVTAALRAIADEATTENGLLTALSRRLDNEAEALQDDRSRVEEREENYRARLERQFGTLDVRLASFQATQSYLEQQIKIWQGGDN